MKIRSIKRINVSFVLMKMKSHFNILNSLLTKVVKKTFSEKYSHVLFSTYVTILSICVCSLSRVSQINAKIRRKCVQEEFVRVYDNDTLCYEAFV